jgi:hypothetical protein
VADTVLVTDEQEEHVVVFVGPTAMPATGRVTVRSASSRNFAATSAW